MPRVLIPAPFSLLGGHETIWYTALCEFVKGTGELHRGNMSEGEVVAGEAFSLYAPHYDAEQSTNMLARWQRRESLRVLARSFKPGARLLEIGCGTGEEALVLARRGVSVMATDAAEGMIEQLRAKLARLAPQDPVRHLVAPRVLEASRIVELSRECGRGAFDGVYSSFGPLNCETNIAGVAASLAELVRPGGRVVISLINRYCAWEVLWHLARLEPNAAFRRWGGYSLSTVRIGWQEMRVPVYYWTPRFVERTFHPHFRLLRVRALTWALPPMYLSGWVARHPRLFTLLARLERRYSGKWPFNVLGDHVLLVLERRCSSAEQPVIDIA